MNESHYQEKEDAIAARIMDIMDPELHIDIWTLGLIYDIDVMDDHRAKVTMTLTSPTCPYAPVLIEGVKTALLELGYDQPDVQITFTPPWEAPEFLRESLGL